MRRKQNHHLLKELLANALLRRNVCMCTLFLELSTVTADTPLWKFSGAFPVFLCLHPLLHFLRDVRRQSSHAEKVLVADNERGTPVPRFPSPAADWTSR